MRRRDLFRVIGSAAGVAAVALAGRATSAEAKSLEGSRRLLPWVEVADGTRLFYKDWGDGPAAVFTAAWCLTSAAWDYQTTYLCANGIRCIAYDRRGHGRSSQPGRGYDFDTLSDDLGAIMEQLDLRGVTLIGHSMGAGEVVRYLHRHGSSRVARIVLIAPITPFLLKTHDNPDGIDRAVFERGRAAASKDFPKVLWDNWPPFFVPHTPRPMMEWAASLMLECPLKVALDCHRSFSETDFRPDLPGIDIPTLIIQGTADVSAPINLTGRKTAKLIRGSQFKVYEGAPHGLIFTHMDRLNGDLIDFIRSPKGT